MVSMWHPAGYMCWSYSEWTWMKTHTRTHTYKTFDWAPKILRWVEYFLFVFGVKLPFLLHFLHYIFHALMHSITIFKININKRMRKIKQKEMKKNFGMLRISLFVYLLWSTYERVTEKDTLAISLSFWARLCVACKLNQYTQSVLYRVSK